MTGLRSVLGMVHFQAMICVKIGTMSERQSTTVRSVLPFGIIMGFSGWGGLIYLMTQTRPSLGNRWLFFCAVVVAVTGTAAPAVALINRMFSSQTPVSFGMVIREALWVGIYAAAIVWLNKGQVVSLGLVVVLALGFILVEFFLRMRARSEWHPGEISEE